MTLTNPQLDEFKDFLIADSHGLGIAAKLEVGDHGGVADIMNAIQPDGWAQVDREPVSANEINEQITAADLIAMTNTQKQSLVIVWDPPQLNLANVNTMEKLKSCFPPAGDTITNLELLSKRQGRAMEVLFGNGATATANNVSDAMARP